jgi:hypothetical protein
VALRALGPLVGEIPPPARRRRIPAALAAGRHRVTGQREPEPRPPLYSQRGSPPAPDPEAPSLSASSPPGPLQSQRVAAPSAVASLVAAQPRRVERFLSLSLSLGDSLCVCVCLCCVGVAPPCTRSRCFIE